MDGNYGFSMGKSILVLLVITMLFIPFQLDAQCAMCRAVLESEGNDSVAEGVNNGIVYLMAIPYILIAVLFYFVFKAKKVLTSTNKNQL